MPVSPHRSNEVLHVAAAVITRGDSILIAKRPDHLHQGGLWEFPGGKVEAGESVTAALVRELREELAVHATRYRPLIRIPYDYGDRKVLLDVWWVDEFAGEARGVEGQELRWVLRQQLRGYSFPAANRPIVQAALLPDLLLITPEPGADQPFLLSLERSLQQGLRMVQLRAPALDTAAYTRLALQARALCQRYGAVLMLNTAPELLQQVAADGLHLTSRRLLALQQRPVGHHTLVAASCHTIAEVEQANRLGLDYIIVSPVAKTHSHPNAVPIGWEGLRRLTERAQMPVYALGGMQAGQRAQAWEHGAQGIAAIRGLWRGEETVE